MEYQFTNSSRIATGWSNMNKDLVVCCQFTTSSNINTSWISLSRDLVVYYYFNTRLELDKAPLCVVIQAFTYRLPSLSQKITKPFSIDYLVFPYSLLSLSL